MSAPNDLRDPNDPTNTANKVIGPLPPFSSLLAHSGATNHAQQHNRPLSRAGTTYPRDLERRETYAFMNRQGAAPQRPSGPRSVHSGEQRAGEHYNQIGPIRNRRASSANLQRLQIAPQDTRYHSLPSSEFSSPTESEMNAPIYEKDEWRPSAPRDRGMDTSSEHGNAGEERMNDHHHSDTDEDRQRTATNGHHETGHTAPPPPGSNAPSSRLSNQNTGSEHTVRHAAHRHEPALPQMESTGATESYTEWRAIKEEAYKSVPFQAATIPPPGKPKSDPQPYTVRFNIRPKPPARNQDLLDAISTNIYNTLANKRYPGRNGELAETPILYDDQTKKAVIPYVTIVKRGQILFVDIQCRTALQAYFLTVLDPFEVTERSKVNYRLEYHSNGPHYDPQLYTIRMLPNQARDPSQGPLTIDDKQAQLFIEDFVNQNSLAQSFVGAWRKWTLFPRESSTGPSHDQEQRNEWLVTVRLADQLARENLPGFLATQSNLVIRLEHAHRQKFCRDCLFVVHVSDSPSQLARCSVHANRLVCHQISPTSARIEPANAATCLHTCLATAPAQTLVLPVTNAVAPVAQVMTTTADRVKSSVTTHVHRSSDHLLPNHEAVQANQKKHTKMSPCLRLFLFNAINFQTELLVYSALLPPTAAVSARHRDRLANKQNLPLRIATWNVQGAARHAFRNMMIQELFDHNISIACLQEIHARPDEIVDPTLWLGPIWSQWWQAIISPLSAILIRKSTVRELKCIKQTERLIFASAKLIAPITCSDGQKIAHLFLCGMYAPVNLIDRKLFFTNPDFTTLIPSFHGEERMAGIILGDFNDFPDQLDKTPQSTKKSFRDTRCFQQLIGPLFSRKGFIDPLRTPLRLPDGTMQMNTEYKFYTCSSTTTTGIVRSRIDHILISKNLHPMLLNLKQNYGTLETTSSSDHKLLALTISRNLPDIYQNALNASRLNAARVQAPPAEDQNVRDHRWTLNPAWCHSKQVQFRKNMKEYSDSMKLSQTYLHNEIPQDEIAWQRFVFIKRCSRSFAIHLTKVLPTTIPPTWKNSHIDYFRQETEKLEQLENDPAADIRQLRKQRDSVAQIRSLIEEEYNRFFQKTLHLAPTLPLQWLQRVKAQSEDKGAMPLIKNPFSDADAETIEESLRNVESFYASLYQHAVVEPESVAAFLPKSRKNVLTKTDITNLLKPFSAIELASYITDVNQTSMPGPDGLPGIFYKVCPILLEELARVGTACLFDPRNRAEKSPTLICSLLPKKGDLSFISNWRPIMLMDASERLLSAALVGRIFAFESLDRLIDPQQVACIPNRVIFDHILGIHLMVEANALGLTTKAQLACMIDWQKAFDNVAHDWIYAILKHEGFPPQFIDLVRRKNEGAHATFKVNELMTAPVSIDRGVLQGDPISPIIFNIQGQPALDRFEEEGIHFEYKDPTDASIAPEKHIKTPAYADDWLPCVSLATLPRLISVLKEYNKATNAKINKEKSISILLIPPSATTRQDAPERSDDDAGIRRLWKEEADFLNIQAKDATVKYLGAYVRIDGNAPTEDHLEVLQKANKWLTNWKYAGGNLLQKVEHLNSRFFGRIWHAIASAGHIETTTLKACENLAHSFLSANEPARFELDKLGLPKEKGGLGLVHPRFMFTAFCGKDIIRNLQPDAPYQNLLLSCMHQCAGLIDDHPIVWLDRKGANWRWDRPHKFPAFWLRIAEACEILDLTLDPSVFTPDECLDLPWTLKGMGDMTAYTHDAYSKMRLNGLRTWRDILQSSDSRRNGSLTLLNAREVSQILKDSNLETAEKKKVGNAFSQIRKGWTSYIKDINDTWREKLLQGVVPNAPRQYRWCSSHRLTQPILLPNKGYVLNGENTESFTIKQARLTATAANFLTPHFIPAHMIRRRGKEEAQTTSGKLWLSMACTSRSKSRSISKEAYSHTYLVANNHLPLMQAEQHLQCCGENLNQQHFVFHCPRAQTNWLTMKNLAIKLGLEAPDILDANEVTDLFPRWREAHRTNDTMHLIFIFTDALYRARRKKADTSPLELGIDAGGEPTHIHMARRNIIDWGTRRMRENLATVCWPPQDSDNPTDQTPSASDEREH